MCHWDAYAASAGFVQLSTKFILVVRSFWTLANIIEKCSYIRFVRPWERALGLVSIFALLCFFLICYLRLLGLISILKIMVLASIGHLQGQPLQLCYNISNIIKINTHYEGLLQQDSYCRIWCVYHLSFIYSYAQKILDTMAVSEVLYLLTIITRKVFSVMVWVSILN